MDDDRSPASGRSGRGILMLMTGRVDIGRTEILSINPPYQGKVNGSALVFTRTDERKAIRSLGNPVALVTQHFCR